MQRTIRRPYSWLTLKAAVEPSPLAGMGILAKEPIPQHELVAFWGGRTLSYAELLTLPDDVRGYQVQVWFDMFAGPSRMEEFEPVDYMNHSCDPNCGVVGSVAVVARRDIAAGEELTFDYGTTETVGLAMECQCGAQTCRGTVTNDDWKDAAFRERNQGYLSLYIQELVRWLEGGEARGIPPNGIPALRNSRASGNQSNGLDKGNVRN